MAARKKKTRRKRKTTTWQEDLQTTLFGTKSQRRRRNSWLVLYKDMIALFLLVFGCLSLWVEWQNALNSDYGLKVFLEYSFGKMGWMAGLVSLLWSFTLLYPWKSARRFKIMLISGGLFLCFLGLLEVTQASSGESFSRQTTNGGIVAFQISYLLSSVIGGFLTSLLYITTMGFSFVFITGISLEQLSLFVADSSKKIMGWARRAMPSLNYSYEDQESQVDQKKPLVEASQERSSSLKSDMPSIDNVRLNTYHDSNIDSKHSGYKNQDSKESVESDITVSKPSIWKYPHLNLFDKPVKSQIVRGNVEKRATVIENTLKSFSVEAKVVEMNVGPTITQFAIEPAVGVKVSKITNLQSDLALALATANIRIEAPIAGKPYVGIEVPNKSADIVTLRGLLQSSEFQENKKKIPLCLGRGVSGDVLVTDLTNMPHLLVAGATGSGKSVCINSIIASILYRYSPHQVKLIMVDPKVVELHGYNGIPHLLSPVITKPEPAISSLKWAINEMERRYRLFAQNAARSISGYNERQDEMTNLPYIVVIIDELADLMMAAGNEVEEAIVRLAQKARATGIHLVLATQRPSVDVVTGLIKANVPARVCFAVSSQVDSRVVLDSSGAEKLLGKGDMLYQAPDLGKMVRVQGVFVSDLEINRLVDFWKKQGEPSYLEAIVSQKVNIGKKSGSATNYDGQDLEDELLPEAYDVIHKEGKGSASLLQRRLRIGYARAARLIDMLEEQGVLSPADGSKPREILRPFIVEGQTGDSTNS